jgi:hypothetical protein
MPLPPTWSTIAQTITPAQCTGVLCGPPNLTFHEHRDDASLGGGGGRHQGLGFDQLQNNIIDGYLYMTMLKFLETAE